MAEIIEYSDRRHAIMTGSLRDESLLRTQAYIDGAWTDAETRETVPVQNPATGATIANVAKCGSMETRRAIAAAQTAQIEWRHTVAKERADKLHRWFELILQHQEDLARILTAEQGKPISEARSEIAYGASYVEWFAEEAKRVYGETIAPPSNDKRIVCIRQPVGAVACITPWNFPHALLTRKIAPALAVGCTVVCKPASATPLSAYALAELADRAGFPPGVVNIVTGSAAAIGGELTSNPAVRKLSFTGSTAVGKQLMAECAGTVKRTSMELGGNAPFIVFDDADLDAAVTGLMISKFRNAGQTCVCANRILLQENIHDTFVDKLNDAVSQLRMGIGSEGGVNIGPLINEAAAAEVMRFITDAVENGAKLVAGGRYSKLGKCFVEPTILTDATSEMRVFREEIFGPVAPIFKFETETDAISMANDTEFGLACYFYTRDIGRIWRVAEGLDYGMVGINEGLISNAMAPFGGVKESGHGREGSKYGLEDYLEIKYMCLGGLDQ